MVLPDGFSWPKSPFIYNIQPGIGDGIQNTLFRDMLAKHPSNIAFVTDWHLQNIPNWDIKPGNTLQANSAS